MDQPFACAISALSVRSTKASLNAFCSVGFASASSAEAIGLAPRDRSCSAASTRHGRGATPPKATRPLALGCITTATRSEEHTSELQSLMRLSYAVLCLQHKNTNTIEHS